MVSDQVLASRDRCKAREVQFSSLTQSTSRGRCNLLLSQRCHSRLRCRISSTTQVWQLHSSHSCSQETRQPWTTACTPTSGTTNQPRGRLRQRASQPVLLIQRGSSRGTASTNEESLHQFSRREVQLSGHSRWTLLLLKARRSSRASRRCQLPRALLYQSQPCHRSHTPWRLPRSILQRCSSSQHIHRSRCVHHP